jgi:hypothetical protein
VTVLDLIRKYKPFGPLLSTKPLRSISLRR